MAKSLHESLVSREFPKQSLPLEQNLIPLIQVNTPTVMFHSLQYGTGNWMFWGHGGGIRTGNYRAPEQGRIYNSRSRLSNGGGGLGWYGKRVFFSLEAKFDDGNYGVPFVQEFHGHHGEAEHEGEDDDHDDEEGEDDEEECEEDDEEGEEDDEEGEEDDEEEIDRIELDSRRRNFRFTGGLKDLAPEIGRGVRLTYTM